MLHIFQLIWFSHTIQLLRVRETKKAAKKEKQKPPKARKQD